MSDNRNLSERLPISVQPDFLALFPSELEGQRRASPSSAAPETVSPVRKPSTTSRPPVASRQAAQPARVDVQPASGVATRALVYVACFAAVALASMLVFRLTRPVAAPASEDSPQGVAAIDRAVESPTVAGASSAPQQAVTSVPREPQDLPVTPAALDSAPPAVATVARSTAAARATGERTPRRDSASSHTEPATVVTPLRLAQPKPLDVKLGEQNAPAPASPMVGGASVKGVKFVGSLRVDSQPAGAQVFVDGRPAGVTPLLDWELPAGSHVVRVEADGYSRWSSAVQVVAGKTLSLVANLQPARED
jgi:PEGA domain